MLSWGSQCTSGPYGFVVSLQDVVGGIAPSRATQNKTQTHAMSESGGGLMLSCWETEGCLPLLLLLALDINTNSLLYFIKETKVLMINIKKETPNKSKGVREMASIDTVIIHYTGSTNAKGSVSWFENPDAKVSSHYVVDRNGDVYDFESWGTTLWHAGKSEWNGVSGLNRSSIGIELAGTYHSGFTDSQYKSLLELMGTLYKGIGIKYVLGHEQVSPGRKVDPGPSFNWSLLRTHAEDSNVPDLSRVGPYIIQPPNEIMPIVEVAEKTPPGADKGDSSSSIGAIISWILRSLKKTQT